MKKIKKLIIRVFKLVLSLFLLIQLWIFASLIYWKYYPVETTMFMRIRYLITQDETPVRKQWKDWHEISPYMAQAIIASEDTRFMQHRGFDWHSIEQAILYNQQQGKIVFGGSTISQQLAKNLFLYHHRSWLRKGQEAMITMMMELLWSKQRILEVYMNTVEFGDKVYGVEAASQHYFNRSAKDLTRSQASFLAVILPQPRYYEHHRTKKLKARQKRVLEQMSKSRVPK